MLQSFPSSQRPIFDSQICTISIELLLKSRTRWVCSPTSPPPPVGGYADGASSHVFPFWPFSAFFVNHGMCRASFCLFGPCWPILVHLCQFWQLSPPWLGLGHFGRVCHFGPCWWIMPCCGQFWASGGHNFQKQLLNEPSCWIRCWAGHNRQVKNIKKTKKQKKHVFLCFF